MTLLQYASNTNDIIRADWPTFWRQFRTRWNAGRQGEHVFIYGETGSGKTDLAARLGNSEPYAAFLVTKPGDPIFKSPLTRGWKRANEWQPRLGDHHIMLSARPGKTTSEEYANQKLLFPPALDAMYRAKGWTIIFDEGLHMTDNLGMSRQLSSIFYLGRASKTTGILCSQRPKRIPVLIPQSCEHAFISRSRRTDDIDTLSELGLDKRELRNILRSLGNKHDFVYIDTQGELPVQIVNTHNKG